METDVPIRPENSIVVRVARRRENWEGGECGCNGAESATHDAGTLARGFLNQSDRKPVRVVSRVAAIGEVDD